MPVRSWSLVVEQVDSFCLKNCLMEEHIQALLQCFQYSEQFKETAAFRIVFGGETLSQVMADLDSHNSYKLRN